MDESQDNSFGLLGFLKSKNHFFSGTEKIYPKGIITFQFVADPFGKIITIILAYEATLIYLNNIEGNMISWMG